MQERENNLKLCLLCNSKTGNYTDTQISLHEQFGLHSTNGFTWQPTKNHEDFPFHVRMRELGIISNLK